MGLPRLEPTEREVLSQFIGSWFTRNSETL